MDYKVSIEFGAKLDTLSEGIKQLIGQFSNLTVKIDSVGGSTQAATRQAGDALAKQLDRPAQAAAGALKGLDQAAGQAAQGAQGLKEKAAQAGSALDGLAASGAHASGSTQSLVRDFALGSLAAHLLEQGVEVAVHALEHFMGEGLKFNVTMESARLGIGALISAQTQMRDSSGRVLEGQEALSSGMRLADGVMKQLRAGSFQTIATLEELTAAYQQGVGPMLASKVPLQDTTRLTVKFAQAAGALGLDINTLGHELRATFNGEISPRITKIAAALQIRNEDIQAWKEAGTLVENLDKKLEFFGLAGELVERSWRGAMSNLKHAMEAGAGEILEPFQKQLQNAIVDSVSGAFDKNTAQFAEPLEGILDLGRSVFGRLGDLAGQGVAKVMGGLEQLSGWYVRNQAEVQGLMAVTGNLSAFLGDTLGVALSTVCTVAQALVVVLGSYPGVTTTVVFALGGLAVANLAAGLSFGTVATQAFWAAGAVYEFFLALGPVGWVLGAVGALAGVFVAMAKATERAKAEQQAHADAMHKSNQEANELNGRYQTLNERLKSGTLTLGERILAEKEMRDILEKLKRTGQDYLSGIDLERLSLEQLAAVLQKVTDKRNQDEQAKRTQAKSELDRARAELLEAKQRLEALEHGRMPDNGKTMSADQQAMAATEWIPRAVEALRTSQAEVDRLTKMVGTYGDAEQQVVLTLKQQVEMRDKLLKEEKDLRAEKERLLASPDSTGADEAFKKVEARLKEIEKLKAQLRTSGLTVEARPDTARVDPENKFVEEMLRLRSEELRYAQQLTMESRKKAELDKVDLDLAAERARTQKEVEKKHLSTGERAQVLAKAEDVAQKAKANIEAKYAEEERQFQERHQLDLLQVQGRGLEAQVLQRRQAAQAKVEDMRKHGATESEIQVYQAAVQAGIDRDLTKAGDDLQDKLATSQGKGWERRKGLIDKEFRETQEKLKELNLALVQVGKLDPGQLGSNGLTASQGTTLQGAKGRAMDAGRLDQVREDVGRLKQELAELAQIKGHALSLDEQTEAMARFARQSETASDAAAKVRQELHIDDSASQGLQASLNGWMVQAQNGFQRWKGLGDSVLNGAENSIATFYTSLTQHGQTALEKLRGLWTGFSQVVVQALMKMAAQETILWGIEKAKLAWTAIKTAMAPKSAAVEVAASQAKATAATTETGANTSAAVSGFTAAHAKIPFVGWAIALGFIMAFLGLMSQLKARAVGGRVDRPEVTLLGEAGPEIVAPESTFHDWAREYMATGAMAERMHINLAQQERGIQVYRQFASDLATNAQVQGGNNIAAGNSFGAAGQYFDLRGSINVGTGSKQWAEMVMQGQRRFERANG